ncbi:phage baseplate protein, partial [Cronobacter sakazakii]
MDFLSTLLRNNQRRIGVLVPDVVISESHKDTLNVTSHPVEFGAAIAD